MAEAQNVTCSYCCAVAEGFEEWELLHSRQDWVKHQVHNIVCTKTKTYCLILYHTQITVCTKKPKYCLFIYYEYKASNHPVLCL